MPAIKLPPLQELPLGNFDGGLNLRDAPSEVADNETPDCLNVTLDERGGVVSRLGRARKNLAGALPGTPQLIVYWQSQQIVVFQIGAVLYKTTDDFGTWSSFATLTTTARVGVCEFQGKLVVVHPVDGVFTYDATTWTLATASVKGSCCAVWQNKVWVSGNDSTVWWSNAGNPAVYTIATDFNALREKDDQPVVALGIGMGVDIAGRPGLLAFKTESCYRINSSTTGAYTTLDAAAGCVGPYALTTAFGYTIFFAKSGIYRISSGGESEPELVSGKLSPLWDDRQINFAALANVVAGVFQDRVVFSIPWGAAQTSNNRTIEYHPIVGWMVWHDFGASSFATYGKNKARLYAASPSSAYVFEQFVGGNDDAAAINAHFKTRWYKVANGAKCSFRHLRLWGRGAFACYVLLDFNQGQGELNDFTLEDDAFIWNTVNWNDAAMIWGPTVYEGEKDFWSLGFGRYIQFNFVYSGTASASAPKLLGDGAAPEVGAFAAYELQLEFVRLGNS